MLYLLTFGGDPASVNALVYPESAGGPEVGRWAQRLRRAGKLLAVAKLKAPYVATTVRFSNGSMDIVDGPFSRDSESIAGFCIVDATDLDEVLTIARSWPLEGFLEIRPLASPASRLEVVTFPAQVAVGGTDACNTHS